ncbi:hypothetical protein NQ176_g4366 [Zarea fungicola]|uniref:Uncharacterized protein n=1 Tax=Zarea fungicola TaxID=93591 RepID=A0ACC1NFZ6_9HYPO|nr:hypothetical protein NQ176_g4366 [Lecanicillium fungicola]
MTSIPKGDSRFNPLHGNPFKTKGDVAQAVHSLFNPILPLFSEGFARVQVDAATSTWDRTACDLEGYARPLFGLAPLAAGGGHFEHWEIYRQGLKNGTDPEHVEYWGDVPPMDQRQVDAAALAYGILVAPKQYWEPLAEDTKQNVAAWLVRTRNGDYPSNNIKFFRIMVDLALETVGMGSQVDSAGTIQYLNDMDNLYMSDGWYRDGKDPGDTRRIDYYNPFAMHFYGMIYAVHKPEDKERSHRFKERAKAFASSFIHWFADTGASIPYGRSLSYRMCVAAFWGYLPVAGIEIDGVPLGVIKGLYLRNLRWWAEQPITRRDGILTLGYSYPNPFLAERYLSPSSPFWAMKAFGPLSLPDSHPFWTVEELPMPMTRSSIAAFPIPGLVFTHSPGHTVMLTAGPSLDKAIRNVPEKYLKFAYSTRYGFSISSDAQAFSVEAFDSMIAFSHDEIHYRVRERCDMAMMAGNVTYTVWHPWTDVKVETWLVPYPEWHVRVHRIHSPRKLFSIEGGFAAPRHDNEYKEDIQSDKAWVVCDTGDMSGIVDASPSANDKREARVAKPHGNTNVMFPRTVVPQLKGVVEAGQPSVFACAVLAGLNSQEFREIKARPPSVPTVEELEDLFHVRGRTIDIVRPYPSDTDSI